MPASVRAAQDRETCERRNDGRSDKRFTGHIEQLVAEERELWEREERGEGSDDERARLTRSR